MAWDKFAAINVTLDQFDVRITAAEAGGTPTPTPAASFTSQPTISPSSGTAGTTTFTATPGVVANGSVTSRAWLLNGTSISTGTTAAPNAAGTLTYQEFATGPGGNAQSVIRSATVAAAPTPTPTAVNAFAADGYSATWNSGTPPTFQPDTAPNTIDVVRQGFTATAGSGNRVVPITFTEQRTFTMRKRQPYPNDAVLTSDQVVMDDFVYTTDVYNGTLPGQYVPDQPICHQTHAPRKLIDSATNQCFVAIRAEHRDGIAAAVVSLSDGVTTLTQTIINSVVSNRLGDAGAVQHFQHTFDTSSLNAGQITEDWKVYPRIGGADAVIDTSGVAPESRSFCRLIRVKGPAYYVYVDSATGNDTTGTVSTDPAVAAASPVATTNGAIVRARALMPSNRTSGLFVRHRAGTWALSNITFNTYQDANSAEVVFTRDPTVAASSVNFTYGAAVAFQLLYFAFDDVGTITRTASVNINSGSTSLAIRARNCALDFGGFIANFGSGSVNTFFEGNVQVANPGLAALSHTTGKCHMMRGMTVGTLTGTTINVDAWNMAGCDFKNAFVANSASAESGAFIEGTFIRTISSGGSGGVHLASQGGVSVSGIAMRNVLIEYNGPGGSTPGTGLRISADAVGSNTKHVVLRGVEIAGQGNAGRFNGGYDDSTGTTRRTHTGWKVEGCLFGQYNTKSDRFVGVNQANADAPNRTGGWSVNYSVGWKGDVYRGVNAADGSLAFGPDFIGMASKIGTSATPLDLLYTNYQAATQTGASTYVAGAGGGTYTKGSGSLAKGVLTGGRNAFDIAGAARPSPDTAGAYA